MQCEHVHRGIIPYVTTLRDELMRIYRDSGVQNRADQLFARFAEEVIARVVPPGMLDASGIDPQSPPAPPKPPAPPDPYIVLGVSRSDPMDLVEAVFRTKVKFYHPDAPTGNQTQFILIKDAYDQIKKERN